MSSNTTTITVTKAQKKAIQAILAGVGTTQPATEKAARKGSKKARKTANRKAAGTTIAGKTCLVSKNRKQFIADHGAKPGSSVRELCLAVASGEITLVGNWAIGPRNAERFGVTTPAAETAPAPKTAVKVFRRANGTTAPKSEWAIRAALEAQGLDRKEVDEKTAAAVAVLNA